MSPMKFTTRLQERIPRVGDVVTFRFDKPGAYEYQAGQWGVIDIPGEGEPLSHHFTHASSPTEPFLDITTHVRQSPFKQALDSLDPGARVEMEGPFGGFVLDRQVGRAVFLTGGIGITPVRSILSYLADSGAGEESRELVLLYGSRDEDHIVYRDELERLNDQIPFLEVLHVLEDPSAGWRGYRGRIDGDILADALEDPAGWTYFVSGPPSMVDAMRELLRSLDIARDAIIAEDFTGYA